MTAAVPVHDALFADGAGAHLLGGRCAECGAHHFPQHDTCPYCAQPTVEAVALSPTGHLWAWTAVTAAPPGYRGEVPYGFGVVQLPEGVRIVSRLTESDPSKLRVDQPMELVIVPLHSGDDERPTVLTWAWAPAE